MLEVGDPTLCSLCCGEGTGTGGVTHVQVHSLLVPTSPMNAVPIPCWPTYLPASSPVTSMIFKVPSC